ncbi:alpha-L-fucosidase [Pareuzebyella sediminis]|uniref:alpha-L-fucosidase n=1 Tax=Pareuzebyella sediminis TaxID=2607998 RepID=UPI0011EEEED6|nr:alpha-L-fucosidase [Pareuzebyella sediminis]
MDTLGIGINWKTLYRRTYLIAFTCFIGILSNVNAQNEPSVPIPTPAQLQWQNAELAALLCIDLHAFDGKLYVQQEARITPVEDYNIFNPQHYDMDQWIKALRDAGFKIAILTVSHETGFFFHQSDATPYSMKALKWQDGKGDILRDFKTSCEKYGILPGVYIGTRWNAFYGVYDFKVNGTNAFAENRQKHYNSMIENIVTEIFSRYGDWAIVWFDGGAHGPEQGGPDVLSIFEKYQPNCLFYHNLQRADMRWGGSESGTVPYPSWGTFPYVSTGAGETAKKEIAENNFQLLKTGDPHGAYYMPAMSDAPLRGNGGHDWFWEPDREHLIFSLNTLVDMYYNSVGHNTSLILGVPPGPDGLLPEPDVKRLKEFGDEIKRRFSNPIGATSGSGRQIALRFPKHRIINQLVLMEDISKGERVRKFRIEGKTKKGWQPIFEGSCIGHKLIHRFDEMEVSAVRLLVTESKGEPNILNFSAFHTAPE